MLATDAIRMAAAVAAASRSPAPSSTPTVALCPPRKRVNSGQPFQERGSRSALCLKHPVLALDGGCDADEQVLADRICGLGRRHGVS
jgi:hypothetical protein